MLPAPKAVLALLVLKVLLAPTVLLLQLPWVPLQRVRRAQMPP